MQLRFLLCALVAMAAYATPIVAPNSKSVKLISTNDNVANLKEHFDVIRLKRAAKSSWEEGDAPRLEDFRKVMSMFEKYLSSERLTRVKNMSGMMSEMVKLIMQFLQVMENHMNSNNVDHSSE